MGGLKATFLTDFLHTAIALILIIYFTLAVLTNSQIGGLSGLYDKVVATASDNYVSGNYEGSLLTFKSKGAIIWGLILKFGNLALVVMVRFLNPNVLTVTANVSQIGHRVLAKIICDRSSGHSPRLHNCCASGVWDTMGTRNRHWVGDSSDPQYANIPYLPWSAYCH